VDSPPIGGKRYHPLSRKLWPLAKTLAKLGKDLSPGEFGHIGDIKLPPNFPKEVLQIWGGLQKSLGSIWGILMDRDLDLKISIISQYLELQHIGCGS